MKHLLILSFLVLGACASKNDPTCDHMISGHGIDRLVVFGDSQTLGIKSQVDNCNYSWANVISQQYDLTLVNTAVGGSLFTSSFEYGALMSTQFEPTDTVMMIVGFNDVTEYGSDPTALADFKTKLQNALSNISPQVKSITIGTGLHPYAYVWNGNAQATQEHIDAVNEVVGLLNLPNVMVTLVDTKFQGNINYYQLKDEGHPYVDGIHINADAQNLVAESMIAASGI